MLAREMAVASTSGRVAMADVVSRAAPALAAAFSRSFASLVGSGVPSPRPQVALQLSTPHGGHINRMIYASESIAELDAVLYKYRKKLRPASIGAAMVKLEALSRYERSTPYALKVQRIASEMEKYVETFADRLALTQVANVVRGMSGVRHRLPAELLVRLAAGVVGDGGLALRYAPDVDLRDLAFGFAGQGFVNPLFWSRLGSALLPRLPSLDPNTLPAIVRALASVQPLPPSPAPASATTTETASADVAAPAADASSPPELGSGPAVSAAREALRLLAGSLDRLQPARLAEGALALAQLGPGLGLRAGPELLDALQAATARSLPSLSHAQLPNLLLSILVLRRAAAAAPTAALPAELVAAAAPHLAAAAPAMQLVHIKRAVEALAPTLAEAAAAGDAAAAAGEVRTMAPALLDLLARRALQVLPAGGAAGASAVPLSNSLMARLPRGGKDAAAALAAAAGPAAALDVPLLGLLDGLARAYAAAAPVVPSGQGDSGPGSGVRALAARLGQLAAAGRESGLLLEAQAASLARSLERLGATEAAKALAAGGEQQRAAVGAAAEAEGAASG